MQPKFAPGPWTLIPRKRMWSIQNALGGVFADVREIGFGPDSQDRTEANARLIAAAPELYAALRKLLSDLDEGRPLNTVEAYAVLRRAEGQ